MNSTKLWMTAQNPSCFGLPMSRHAFGARTTFVVRERVADIAGIKGAAKADRVLTQSYFPGNSAWRPPTC
ncbi:hypothetical protein GCM10023350_19490 [Nocardioides endophyticus]|uniref:Uncharacterized protein n=1 Tax=Nocardioides endophyticus TaxID=1353775 RepID=A0ABP8YQC4_9ACTN